MKVRIIGAITSSMIHPNSKKQWADHLDAGLGGGLLGVHGAPLTRHDGLNLEHFGHRISALFGLDQRPDELVDTVDRGAASELAQGLATGAAEADLLEQALELLDEGVLGVARLFDDLADRGQVKIGTGRRSWRAP